MPSIEETEMFTIKIICQDYLKQIIGTWQVICHDREMWKGYIKDENE